MALHVSFLLILTGLTGIHSITTVHEVSVKTGGSVSIPCRYEPQYKPNVKYLCVGFLWTSCYIAARTNQPNRAGKFSISDDKSRGIFTVTINNVTDRDTGRYWCIVEINNGADYGETFHLSVTSGAPSLYVDHQEVTGTIGGNITVNCHFSDSGEMKWCKLDGFCLSSPSGSIDGATVRISSSVPNVFTVTMSGLRTESSGWYYCVKGDLQMPVHVRVIKRSTTTTTGKPITIVAPSPEHQHVTPIFTSQAPPAPGGQPSPSDQLKNSIIRLSVFICAIIVTLFICFMVKRYRQVKVESSVTETAEGEVRYMRKRSNKRSHEESVDVEE